MAMANAARPALAFLLAAALTGLGGCDQARKQAGAPPPAQSRRRSQPSSSTRSSLKARNSAGANFSRSVASHMPALLIGVSASPVLVDGKIYAIAEDGTIVKSNPPDQNQPLLTLARQKWPARLGIQFNFLMPGEAASPYVIQNAQTLGTMAAFQTNNYFGSTGQGAACSEPVTNPTPCTASTFLTLLETGIYPLGKTNAMRSQYIEVFPASAIAFPASILTGHDEVTSPLRRHTAHH